MSERGSVLPALAKRLDEVRDRRPTNGGLDVVPRWAGAIRGLESLGLRVPLVATVVPSSVTQVDASDERNVVLGTGGMQQDDEFLMVRSEPSNSRIQQHLSTGLVHDAGEGALVLLVEAEQLGVGAPEQSPDLDASSREDRQQLAQPGAIGSEELVVIPSPIHDQNPIAGPNSGTSSSSR